MRNNSTKVENSNVVVYISLLVATIFLLIDGLSGMKGLRNAISYAFEPISYQANNVGLSVQEYFQTFVNLGRFREEFNNLKVTSYDKETAYSNYMILKNENEALKKQIALGNKEAKYVLANVLRDDNVNLLYIDHGSESDVQQGDVVSVGNVFVGIISNVDLKGSTVRLPSDENSHLEVVILKAGQDGSAKANILSSGVTSGSSEGIKVENISMNSEVANGDEIYINDSKVGGFFALGYVVGLSNNPASTYKTAFVSPILDYDNLMQVFVRVD
jgi:cell shape-determining protein MreC